MNWEANLPAVLLFDYSVEVRLLAYLSARSVYSAVYAIVDLVAFSTSDSWKRVPHVAYLYKPDVTDFFDFYKERCRMVAVRPGERKKVTLAHYF